MRHQVADLMLDDGNIEPLATRLREICRCTCRRSRSGAGGSKRGRILRLSRAAIAIVFAAMRRITKTMMTPIDVTRSFTFPMSDMKDIWNAFSVSVFVG